MALRRLAQPGNQVHRQERGIDRECRQPMGIGSVIGHPIERCQHAGQGPRLAAIAVMHSVAHDRKTQAGESRIVTGADQQTIHLGRRARDHMVNQTLARQKSEGFVGAVAAGLATGQNHTQNSMGWFHNECLRIFHDILRDGLRWGVTLTD